MLEVQVFGVDGVLRYLTVSSPNLKNKFTIHVLVLLSQKNGVCPWLDLYPSGYYPEAHATALKLTLVSAL